MQPLGTQKSRQAIMREQAVVQPATAPSRPAPAGIKRIAPSKRGYERAKRALDCAAALAALIALSPVLLVIALVILLDDPHGSPLYVSDRVGKDGRVFRFYKYRTMCVGADAQLGSLLDRNEADGPVFKIKADPRITRAGRFLRKYSIDELPQLLNVLKGDMSFVGPRPPTPREAWQYTAYQRQRLSIKPGLTCYWQVQPRRNDIPFNRWMELDMRYIRERSFWVDLKLILGTVRAMAGGEGE